MPPGPVPVGGWRFGPRGFPRIRALTKRSKRAPNNSAFNIKTLIAPSGVDCMHAKGSA